VPYDDDEEHPLRKHIERFLIILKNNLKKQHINIPIHLYDESFSSIEAAELMINIGKKKKLRSKKGIKDGVAAGLILRNYMNAYS